MHLNAKTGESAPFYQICKDLETTKHSRSYIMTDVQIIKRSAVLAKCAISKDTLYRLMTNGDFPLAITLVGRHVGWYQHEVDEWLLNRPRTSVRVSE